MKTDVDLETLINKSKGGNPTYGEVIPAILEELIRLRKKVRDLEIEHATRQAAYD